MTDRLSRKLHERELADLALRSKSYRRLYGDRRLIDNLDIVNELDGHSGCVNALSWSKSGSLLASGSDDQHLNIHQFQPESSTAQFRLATTVATGHRANIFSVKFMPHSNDRTVITAAGDSEVRVFDLEYAGQARDASSASSLASAGRRSRRNELYNGVRYLSDGDTDCRVYRSHADRVKRIVTESSPHLFLTCSEDGEVRQWDLRQPSSAYPSPRGVRVTAGSDSSVPPALISYKRYGLDLNTISCSASQPHYIALGGAHLHAFLHDRRMTGRDKLREQGKSLSPSGKMSAEEEDLMSQATQCVRTFAPGGRNKTKKTERGHITACKISDARPNEMIVSWSGDHIYSFDLIHDPGDDASEGPSPGKGSNKIKEGKVRKRKRQTNGSQASLSQIEPPPSRSKTEPSSDSGHETALRVTYENGQSEDIPLSRGILNEQPRALTLKERDAQRIAKATVEIRSSLFGSGDGQQSNSNRFSSALGRAASIISDIDEVMREWSYPIDPSGTTVRTQQTLRLNRESARRFVQTAGTLARVLGGRLQTPSGSSPLISHFTRVETRTNDLEPTQKEIFGYDFLKAILLWLDSGIGRTIEGFTRPAQMQPGTKAARRLPIPYDEATTEAIGDYVIPYLLARASDGPVINVDSNKFEVNENRQLFASEKSAVLAFAAAVQIPFADLSSAVIMAEGEDTIQAQDRATAIKYWGQKVARGVLLNAAEGVNFGFVSRAFGGPGRVVREITAEENRMGDVLEEEDEAIQGIEVLDSNGTAVTGASADELAPAVRRINEAEQSGAEEHETDEFDESTNFVDGHDDMHEHAAIVEEGDYEDEDDDEEDEEDDSEDEEDHSSDSEPDEENGVPNPGHSRYMYASALRRRNMREKVGADVPCSGATRSYRGHCNVRTVKDVNYFGLDDEYVVSGSDDGNFFIWDRKTTELVNVLEGDGETVNVIQGHPYETMLAVSGIDNTIKIFSPDARGREIARLGEEIRAADSSQFSSIQWPSRYGRRRQSRRESQTQTTSEPAMPESTAAPAASDADDEDYVAATGLTSRKKMKDAYRIMNQNDVQRQGGNQDAFLTLLEASPLYLLLTRLGLMPVTTAEGGLDFTTAEGGAEAPAHPFNQFS